MSTVSMQVVDSFLLQYNVGQVLFFGFVLATLAVLPLKSPKIVGLQTVGFGLIFVLTPASLMGGDPLYKLFGLALLFVGPFIVITATR